MGFVFSVKDILNNNTSEDLKNVNNDIEKEIREFKMILLRKHPFYGDVLMNVPFVESKTIDTAATDGRTILYNKNFMSNLKKAEFRYVIMHEIFHIMLLHCVRNKGKDPRVWNIACDMIVNSMVDDEARKFRHKGIELLRPKNAIKSIIYDTNVENLYNKIISDNPVTKGTKLVLRENYEWGSKSYKLANEDYDIIINDNISEKDKKELEANIGKIIRGAYEKSRGLAESLEIPPIFIQLVESKKIRWKDYFKNMLETDLSPDVSYATPERKYIHMDLIIPGMGPEEEKLGEVWAFVDSSGSISNDELNEFLTQLYRISKEFKCVVNICYWDTSVTDVYLNIEKEKDILKCTPKHSGGTDINCVYKYIKENKIKPNAMVILTDGYFGNLDFNYFNKHLKRNTILVLSGNIVVTEEMKMIGKIAGLN